MLHYDWSMYPRVSYESIICLVRRHFSEFALKGNLIGIICHLPTSRSSAWFLWRTVNLPPTNILEEVAEDDCGGIGENLMGFSRTFGINSLRPGSNLAWQMCLGPNRAVLSSAQWQRQRRHLINHRSRFGHQPGVYIATLETRLITQIRNYYSEQKF